MRIVWLAIVVVLLPSVVPAQPVSIRRDPAIAEMIAEVSESHIKSVIEKLVGFHTRHTLSETKSDQRGIGAARRWIKAEMDSYAESSGDRLQVKLDAFEVEADGRRITRPATLMNVMATLPGSDPDDDRILIVSGHFDSRASEANDSTSYAPGANDDASGTAVVMELARVMSSGSFPATIIFVAVAGEEQGLFGSSELARKASEEGWNVIAMITNDIVGNSRSSGTDILDNSSLRVFSEGMPANEPERQARTRQAIGGENDGPARQFARYIEEVGERYVDQMDVVMVYRRDRFLRGGDHTPFSRLGFTAVRFSEMNENYIHQHQDVRIEDGIQYGDLPEFVDYPYVKKVAQVNLAVLANLANAPSAPDSVGIVVRRLANDTTLRWAIPSGKRPAGYNVLMRETTSPVWQRKFFVGDVTEATLPYSKDNYIFAVQSVDEAGHESIPVFPFPVR